MFAEGFSSYMALIPDDRLNREPKQRKEIKDFSFSFISQNGSSIQHLNDKSNLDYFLA
jgi:hypothetical protein